ncbi:glycine cleavage system aminomethyltransferase GcvT [Pseudanabaena sp. FACHB-2040]|uniref:glycine cleavage system aminomethyltransferase GcvT n=1 Tax=Pseudanabaena sp. FACHB-2040 TaxID=2692859 RepID=UPI001688D616|nr:glycine cleavage system aminomethyltransferase GcvT [Pseudanabaena sp. FACHB-2040]MBD2258484.1 glycine cleavage system aminomethyltransferase GcvT [Pseudanabaena sp. FACHB-2040]
MSLSQTPLHSAHQQLKARMMPFAGWDMPVQYLGIKQEHQAVRQQVGMFDISHMGKFMLQGPDVLEQMQRLVPSDLSPLIPGKAQYTVLLNPQGGIVDDLILYLLPESANGDQRLFTIINAATTDKDKSWLQSHLTETVTLQDLSREQALVAVQGPEAATQLQPFVKEDLSKVGRYEHLEGTLLGQPAFLARTGYTGEDGFEIMLPIAAAQALWTALLEIGVTPCGLGARDTLRLEAAMPLYGQDISDGTTPLEAGLGWLVHLDRKGDFIGRTVLEQQKAHGVSRRLVGLQMSGRNIARHDYPVLQDGNLVGQITSGTLGPTLGYPVALAYISAALAKVGQALEVEIRGKAYPATVVKRPFYRSSRP